MAIKLYKPTTPTRRHSSVLSSKDITAKRTLRAKISRRKTHAGRNYTGQITVRHQGSGVKRLHRAVDFLRHNFDIAGKVTAIEYDPGRTTRIAVVSYLNGQKAYMIVPEGLQVGSLVMSSQKQIAPEIGNRMPLEFIPEGSAVHAIELRPGSGGILVRSAGGSAVLMGIEGKYAQLKMPSGEVRLVLKNCMATVGVLGNSEHRNVRYGKAGRKRRLGIRPSVRGKVMNPVDHPHGGGEGSNPIGLKHPKTPTGKPALGHLTRKKQQSDRLIIRRRQSKKRR